MRAELKGMRDPYDVLGVSKSASAGEIKTAFRRLAKKLHPDANKHDPKAASRFAEINAAYEILGDDVKRKAFDRGEIDAEGKARFQGFEGFGGGPGGFAQGGFESFTFGPEGFQRGGGRGRSGGFGGFSGLDDILKDVFGGAAAAARARRGGFGGAQFEAEDIAARDVTVALTISLPEAASGVGKRVRLPTGKDVDVKIPAGLVSGQQIRLKGQGLPGPAGPGDALIAVTIAPHPLFRLEGADVRLDLPVTLYEAVLGAKVRVPTLDNPVEVTIPPGTSSGRTFRLKNKGFPAKEGRGDLLASVHIVLPEHADEELEALMRKWKSAKPYDPRQRQP
jgi:DnaJ-class molecular chaperone